MIEMKDSETNEGAASVKSARRVLSIFRFFEKVQTPKTLSEISQGLSYPMSSTLALLRSIQTLGYLTYNLETKCYFPSIRFAMLGQWIPERLFVGGGIIEMMERLAAATGEGVLLSVQNGLFAQHIHFIETTQPLSYRPPLGILRPLLRSAVGKVLLAQQPETQVAKVVERTNSTASDDGRQFDTAEVLKELAEVRRAGYAYSANVFTPGAAIVAVALPVREGDLPMAISIGGPSSRVDTKAIPKFLKAIHAAIASLKPSAA
jgi:DNA-binding IclR family transcriptional regulator